MSQDKQPESRPCSISSWVGADGHDPQPFPHAGWGFILREIGENGTGLEEFRRRLSTAQSLDIDSPGGDGLTALAMARMICESGVPVRIHRAESAGATVAVAARNRTIASNGWLLVHPSWAVVAGGAAEFEAELEQINAHQAELAQHFARHTYLSCDSALALIQAGKVLKPDEALRNGFVDKIGPASDHIVPPPDDPLDSDYRRFLQLATRAEELEQSHAVEQRNKNRKAARESTDSNSDEAMARLVEASSNKFALASAHGIQAALPPNAAARWTCPHCSEINFSPPAMNFEPATCFHCQRNSCT